MTTTRLLPSNGRRLTLLPRTTLALALGLASACATTQAPQGPPPPVAPAVVRYEMEPMLIEAKPGEKGVIEIESFDAEELFSQGGAALSQNRFDDAVAFYDKLLSKFPISPYARPALYNRGLAYRDKKDWPRAIESFKELAEKHADHADAKDALFQLGACYAESENWPTSGEVFARLLERKDLSADDRIEAIARRAFSQYKLGDLDLAERTFRSVLYYRQQIENQERLATDFFLAFTQYNLAEITHERFRRAPIRLPETQMERDLEEKASLLLKAQRGYIDTIKYGNARWASAAGFQVGSLYEELYDAFIAAPVPKHLKGEARDVYVEELHKKIRILLEKSLRWHRENLLMVERLGVDTDWAQKTKVSYAKLLRLLDPAAAKAGEEPKPAESPKPGPEVPSAPERPAPDRPAPPTVERQIL
ncbi:MAG TPA: tetratricopeptide repeat protein [Polyangia bacterium]